ncbi:MAG TPA: universal stress protein [Candidatus Baltobacteraceae bacterium]|nr:universal stress protein [Candidatus Baltobacteraceae bacterium]
MLKRILVPLDGTAESEHVLPIVEHLARGAGATVRFLHVTPWPETVQAVDGCVMAYADQRVAGLTTQSENYLDRVAKGFRGVATERVVRFGEAAEQILEEAAAWPADLVVILDLHRTGIGSWWHSSLAEQLRRNSDRPLLVYEPPAAVTALAKGSDSGCAH